MFAVPTDKLKPGKILAEEVRDINGRLLLARGNEIGDNHIRIFKIWGVSEVSVEGPAQSSDKFDLKVNPEMFEQVSETVKVLFQHTDLEHPIVKKIFNLAVQFRCEQNLVETESVVAIDENEIVQTTDGYRITDSREYIGRDLQNVYDYFNASKPEVKEKIQIIKQRLKR